MTSRTRAVTIPTLYFSGAGDVYAIIEDSGTQIRVAEGDIVEIDLRELSARTKKVKFERVLLIGDSDGGEAAIGTPYVSGAAVTAEVLGAFKGEKIDVVKFKRRKGYRVKRGHRQSYLRVKIDEISGPGAAKRSRTTRKATEESAG